MVTDATKKYREPMAYGLIAVAVLVLIGSLSLLFKSGDDLGGDVGFAEKAAFFGGLFESALPVLSMVAAVILVTRLGEPSANARIVVLAALGIGGVNLLFGIITFFAQFGADSSFTIFAGVSGAGKIVGVFLGLAQLLFLTIAMGYFFTAFQSLPAPAAKAAPAWPGGPGFGQYGAPNQQPWAPPGQSYPQGGQQSWGQQGSSYGWATPGESQPQSWGQQAPAAGGQPGPAGGWAAPPTAAGWGQQPGYAAAPPAAGAPTHTGSTVWGAEPQVTDAGPAVAAEQPAEEEQPPVTPQAAEDPQEGERPDAAGTDENDPSAGRGWWQHPGP